MIPSTYDMTHINYKNVKERMSETSKGFWKVQSIHKLTTKLKMRYNPKDYIILKTIKKPPQKIPPFILFEHEEKMSKKPKKLENQKNKSCGRLTAQNFFITENQKDKHKKEIEDKNKTLFNKIYGRFTYEPYLYNEFQFFCLKSDQRLLPRKFKDVVKDCIALREYKNYINSLQRVRGVQDEKKVNSITQNEINKNEIFTNNKKSMTVICKRNLSDNEILDNVFGDNRNEESILSDNNIKNLSNNKQKEKSSKSSASMKNIRNNYFLIKSKTDKYQDKINLPKLNIKKKFKMK